jgi:hypothetical protein
MAYIPYMHNYFWEVILSPEIHNIVITLCNKENGEEIKMHYNLLRTLKTIVPSSKPTQLSHYGRLPISSKLNKE